MGRRGARRRRSRSDQIADPAAICGGCRPLHHCRADRGARSSDGYRYDRFPPPHAQGQEPAGRVVALTPPPLRISSSCRGARAIAPRSRYARDPSAALHGLDGLCLPTTRAKIRDHRWLIRRTLPARPLRGRRSRSPRRRRDHHRGRNLAQCARARGAIQRVHRLRLLPEHPERVRRAPDSHALRRNLPNVRAAHVPHTTCGAFMAFISMKKIAGGEPQMAIMATLGTEQYTKYVIVVDDDVDIFNINDVMWAIATRVRAEKDIVFVPGAKGAILDPTSDPEHFTLTKMGIDATRPAGRDFAERLTISDEQRARARSLLAAAGVKV